VKDLIVSTNNKKPIYQQIYDQISSQILKGDLQKDFNLPSIRTAAKELRVSIITVKKAWEKLENAGLIYTITGKGSFVAGITESDLNNKRIEQIESKLISDLEYYKTLGVTKDEIIYLIEKNF